MALGFPRPTRQKTRVTIAERISRPTPIIALLAALCAAGVLWAQLERGDQRGVNPIDGSGSYEVSGVEVDIAARDAETARSAGWRAAQRKGWAMLWARTNGQPEAAAPRLPDSTLDSIAGAIVVEHEQISAHRYIASLGILFDRARTGELLGAKGAVRRSAPMLVIPIEWSGGAPISFELRNQWQKAWARFRSGNSPVDYVRVSGTGADPILLNAAQTRRPGRGWWRMLLDQYGAADIVVPEVALQRQWPGGPVIGTFTARHGPDGKIVDSFTLRAETSEGLPAMLDKGAARIDAAYVRALQAGELRADPTLVIENAPAAEEIPIDDVLGQLAQAASTVVPIQVDTPDSVMLRSAEAALRGVTGITSVETASLALGGVSTFRVNFAGPVPALREQLISRGWQVEDAGGGLRIRRAPPAPPASAR
ncbi:heavy-metal-associated domain-containing protein [Sphingomonas crocodyli]|uniref:Heavy-metal-associated domain-containing protein n=1 Tax=Sphingomonas crocodyli TaxID=1979270 RepID=A0A437MAQ0_9SPHN|nr:heavy-metal-associated domain-containing protein [Sphingomonas crocodyli]